MNMATVTCRHHWLVSNAIFAYLAAFDVNAAQRFRAYYREPIDQSISNQMHCANHFWRTQLITLSVSTVSIRECLVDNIDIDTWLQLMAQSVIPELLRLGLPRDLTSFNFPAMGSTI